MSGRSQGGEGRGAAGVENGRRRMAFLSADKGETYLGEGGSPNRRDWLLDTIKNHPSYHLSDLYGRFFFFLIVISGVILFQALPSSGCVGCCMRRGKSKWIYAQRFQKVRTNEVFFSFFSCFSHVQTAAEKEYRVPQLREKTKRNKRRIVGSRGKTRPKVPQSTT